MNASRYKLILYVIALVSVSTIGLQFFWNYKNFKQNKLQVINDIQLCLDNAVDTYYTDLAKENYLAIVPNNSSENKTAFGDNHYSKTDKKGVKHNISVGITSVELSDIEQNHKKNIDSIFFDISKGLSEAIDTSKFQKFTQLKDDGTALTINKSGLIEKAAYFRGKKATDSLKLINNLKTIFISFQSDSLDYKKIDSLLHYQFNQKNFNLNYSLNHLENDKIIFSKDSLTLFPLSTTTNSNYLKPQETIQLVYSNPFKETFARSLGSIFLSTILVLAVISSLFYLLKIIKNQKQLAEVKNDLISNITHEFKTPIATIGVALESISGFDVIEDKEKTKKYVNMSSTQLSKLNVMVEKLLETATLDIKSLELNKEDINLFELLDTMVNRYKIQHQTKTFTTNFKVENLSIQVDAFHFENALNNILDNAIKYGGGKIFINLIIKSNFVEIQFSDNGNALNKDNKNRIFEKFYRIPKGNTHDVKGFGIGLYYTKSIIEKHGGTIQLDLKNNLTTFKITLPNG
ncbi:HAMP domain-containing histidine kinase [Flaviramulus sp. BrNp1-15]|uniref:sensor histidine kinase n=1 Tax=Flaviramulus sp. BrNp1-15 TaxID=2916754 RepID=UPI001EE8BDE3|nr:HAMP domain-containing sensor histidine kinase [Flaviramulus sp. BrNp1-15]ULC59300.1 HAMP domain-containing histidine kinase [Flaviramulus sp. BrNp1-15]